MMQNRNQIIEKANSLFKRYGISECSMYIDRLESILKTCPNDELLEDASVVWMKKLGVLQVGWYYGDHHYFILFVSLEKISWKIRFGDTYYNDSENDGKVFFQLFQECDDILEDIYIKLTSKLESKKEFYYELKRTLDHYIASCVHGADDGITKFLGVNKENYRSFIDVEEKFDKGYDVYNLNDFLDCYNISFKDKYWDLTNVAPLLQLAEKYIPVDNITSTYEDKFKTQKTISVEEFRERFRLVFRIYLRSIDSDNHRRMKWLMIVEREKKYLGIRKGTNSPEIGIIEALDNCDVFEIDDFLPCFHLKDGRYVHGRITEFNENVQYQLLENRYYGNYPNIAQEIRPIKTAQETRLTPNDYIRMLYDEFSDNYDYFEYPINYTGGKYIYIPKLLMNVIKPKEKDSIDRELEARKLCEKGKELKRKFDYLGAVEVFDSCLKLNTPYNKEAIDNMILCFHKLKDYESEKRIAQFAFDIAPLDRYKEILNRDLSSNVQLTPKDYSITSKINLGREYEKELRKNPEYTFRREDDPRYEMHLPETSQRKYESIKRKFEKLYRRIKEIVTYFQGAIAEGKEHEKFGNIEAAVTVYEKIISEGCFNTFPYDRLIVIYSKLKRKDDLRRILELSIEYFQSLEKKQWDYVQYLAEKYNAKNLLEEELNYNGKVGSWYPYVYLYQSYPIVEKWKERLAKM